MAAAPMEAQTAQPPSAPSSAVVGATYPRWVMLDPKLEITSGDSKTLAAARSSHGDLIQVSLRLAEPPAVSCVCLHQIPRGFDLWYSKSKVLAAHGDSVLIEVPLPRALTSTADRFVYSAGDAAADPPRPPSLSLLPLSSLLEEAWLPLFSPLGQPTGLVRRGEDELVVAQLSAVPVPLPPVRATLHSPELELNRVAELRLFRNGEWSIKSLQIRLRDDSEFWAWERPSRSSWSAVIPVGDGLLCWVDLEDHFVVLCDVFEETPTLQFLWLPMESICWEEPSNRRVCATAGGDALKFVDVFRRCCCGCPGASSCHLSCGAYTIKTWTMRIGGGGDGDMVWVKDSIVDCSELWALDTYKGRLRCLPLDHPVVSLDQPELICFWLHDAQENAHHGSYDDGYNKHIYGDVDLLMVNTRSKTIHSVSRGEYGSFQMGHGLVPSNVSYFFNSYPSSGSSDAAVSGHRQVDIERPLPVIVDEQLITEDDGSNPTALASFAEPSVQAFFEAFQEISSYGLGHDEQKLYRILSCDNCRRFKSLLRLPKNLRKDWLLMEIKTSEDGS